MATKKFREERRSQLRKHATHDQSTHGNWADGGKGGSSSGSSESGTDKLTREWQGLQRQLVHGDAARGKGLVRQQKAIERKIERMGGPHPNTVKLP